MERTRSKIEEHGRTEALARGLGWFSLGLGVTALAAPGPLARLIGAPADSRTTSFVRLVGLRELASGAFVLSKTHAPAPLWARAAGDLIDLTLLGAAARSPRANRARIATAVAAVMGVTMLDVLGGRGLGGSRTLRAAARSRRREGITVRKAITIRRSPEEVYGYWRDLENLPRFLRHLESVTAHGDGRSRWRTKGPAGTTVEWEAELVEDRPNERIAWRSVEGSPIETSGSVRFVPAPGDRGTEVHVEMRYRPPLGKAGASLAKLFREAPEQQMTDDLHALKQLLETGEVTVSDASVERGRHPGQPPRLPTHHERGER